MTAAIQLPKSARRIHTDADLARATDMAERMFNDLEKLLDDQEQWDDAVRALVERVRDAQSDEASELKELLESAMREQERIVFRVHNLRNQLLTWPTIASNTAGKQLETRHKSGELVTVASAFKFINQLTLLIKRHADPKFKQQAIRESKRLLQEFVRENPASLLEEGADMNDARAAREDRVIDAQ